MDPTSYKRLLRELHERERDKNRALSYPSADLSEADLCGENLSGAHLSGAILTASRLVGANLIRADLRDAHLCGADLGGADLSGADLRGVDLSDVQLDDAVFASADLRDACLRNTRGEPLSMAGARIDQNTIDRSGFKEIDLNGLVARGVILDDTLRPRSVAPVSISLSPPSFVPMLREQECDSRRQSADLRVDGVPPSRATTSFFNQLVDSARLDHSPPSSLVHCSLPQITPNDLALSSGPRIGGTVLGVTIDSELPGSTVARSFLGINQDGKRVVVKSLDPLRPGAAFHLPAFQRGLREMNRALSRGDQQLGVAELLAVAPDLTAYVVHYYPDGNLHGLCHLDLSLDAGLSVFEQLCRIVQAAHQRGILVRSIKPSNILLDGFTPILSELDMIDLPMVAQCSMNAGGYGAYAAPEELLGRGNRSPTADIYALGKVLEYLLTGHEPTEVLVGDSLLRGHMQVPQFLVQLVDRCTRPDPRERFQVVGEIIEQLDQYRREGQTAEFNAPLRVSRVSRVAAIASLAPSLDAAIWDPPPQTDESEDEEFVEPSAWISRQLEVGLALIACFGVAVVMFAVWNMPSKVDFVERAWIVAALLVGTWTWVLPRPRKRLVQFRLATSAVLWLAMLQVGPLPLARARWHHDLQQGTPPLRARAAENLIRTGTRDLTGTNLDRITLVARDLSLVSFRGASLREANLSQSFIRESDFENADLTDALVYGADLRLARLGNARGLHLLRCDDATLFPQGIACVEGAATRVGDGPVD